MAVIANIDDGIKVQRTVPQARPIRTRSGAGTLNYGCLSPREVETLSSIPRAKHTPSSLSNENKWKSWGFSPAFLVFGSYMAILRVRYEQPEDPDPPSLNGFCMRCMPAFGVLTLTLGRYIVRW